MIKIGIIEDIQKTREHLVARLSFIDSINVMFSSPSAEHAISTLNSLTKENLPDILLMDIGLPGISGIEATIRIREKFPEIKILIQTIFEDDTNIFKAIQSGASGYILKDEDINSYKKALEEIHNGGASMTPSIALKVLSFMKSSSAFLPEAETSVDYQLTDRELEILKLITDDLSEPEIGKKLFISPHTVHTHIKNIYKKLEVSSRVAAVKLALEKGLLQS